MAIYQQLDQMDKNAKHLKSVSQAKLCPNIYKPSIYELIKKREMFISLFDPVKLSDI